MAVKIDGIGHCALRVRDVDRSRRFYVNVLGFELLEQDPEHGGVFLSLPGTSHTIDVFAPGEMGATTEEPRGPSPLVHIAFRVGSYAALREAHDTLLEHRVKIWAMIDHVNQRSIYFADPDGNGLELYYERQDWAEIFARGRGDQDQPFTFDEPAPEWSAS